MDNYFIKMPTRSSQRNPFKDPTDKYARRTLTIIIAILMVMLGGIAYLVRAYNIAATEPGAKGYESVLSQLIGAVAGKGGFYWLSMGSIFAVLALSANTAFADFPRLSRAIANNGFLPHALTLRGRRLVFEQGVYALALLAGLLLTIFGGRSSASSSVTTRFLMSMVKKARFGVRSLFL